MLNWCIFSQGNDGTLRLRGFGAKRPIGQLRCVPRRRTLGTIDVSVGGDEMGTEWEDVAGTLVYLVRNLQTEELSRGAQALQFG